jgi:S1-C subfamily serine protease
MRWPTFLLAGTTVLAISLVVALGVVLVIRLQQPLERPALDPRVQLTVTPIATLPPWNATPAPAGTPTPAPRTAPGTTPLPTPAGGQENPARAAIGSVVKVQGSQSVGTGFAWAKRDGELLLVTAAHVVDAASVVTVIAPDGTEHPAHVLTRDPVVDIAVLEVADGLSLEPLARGDSQRLAPGDPLYVVGFALGTELLGDPTVTRGVLSGRRVVDGVEYLQTDAAMNPGNSGGPVLDDQGRVVGIAIAVIRDAQGVPTEGLNFAVTVEEAIAVAGS